MELKDYYGILGVKQSDDEKTIKTAYRRLARKYHPDVSKEKGAEDKFKEVAEAWDVLKDKDRRAEYDQLWQHRNDPRWQQAKGGQGTGQAYGQEGFNYDADDLNDIFSSIFGARGAQGSQQSSASAGQDLEISVAVFLEETTQEHSRTISYKVPSYNQLGMLIAENSKKLNVKIPAGVTDGQRIRLKGQGGAGINGGPNGDLWLVIKIAPHPFFNVVEQDLEIVMPMAPWEAALGKKIEVPTLQGSVLLNVPAGTQNGQRLRIKGKGLGNKTPGDLFAIVKISMPPKPDEKSAAIWQQLADANQSFAPRKNWGKA